MCTSIVARDERILYGLLGTPFRPDDKDVDFASLSRLVKRYMDVGVSGLVLLGVLAENDQLEPSERVAIVEHVSSMSADTPLVLGISSLQTDSMIEEIRLLRDLGIGNCTYMVKVNAADKETLRRNLADVYAATGQGLILQDHPLSTGVRINPEILADIVNGCEYIKGIKAEDPPTIVSISRLAQSTDRPVFGGSGARYVVEELGAGASGFMTGFTFPHAIIRCMDIFEEHGLRSACEYWNKYVPIAIFEGQPGPPIVRKILLQMLGIYDSIATKSSISMDFPVDLIRELAQHHLSLVVD